MPKVALKRDESGRLLAPDGWPVGGLARVREISAATGLCVSEIYEMTADGRLDAKRFGRSVRVPWQVVRAKFLDRA